MLATVLNKVRRIPSLFPLRIRLTLWYTFSLALILGLFTTFLYVQVNRSLISQVDAALGLAAGQAQLNLGEVNGRLTLQSERNPEALRRLNDDFVIYLRAPDGTLLDVLTSDNNVPQFQPLAGFHTLADEGESWRVFTQEVSTGSRNGQLQVAQELDPLLATLSDLRSQIFWGLPLAILLAGLGGFFLAARALRPIDHITRTAQAISSGELERRIHYQGAADEVGRLAQTFDKMLDRLQAAFTRERRFTGDAAHELRTPLTALKGHIGVTLSRPRPAGRYRETLQEMEIQVDRLIHLSNDLLFIARLDQGEYQPRLESITLVEFIGAVVDQIRPLALEKSLTIVEDIPDGLSLQGDFDLLIRLFLNLLDNAVKYTPQNGRITILARENNNRIQVIVSDTGPGIASEHLPHLFNRFYRVGDDRTRHLSDNGQGGSGLGLAIAYEIAHTLDGQLSVESVVDQGTVFIIDLPVI